ncbi:MAG: hypothetical protein LZF85_09585 [Nitrosomonas sp.]|uniref:hypothetical protein n=1 Tax=Nitrosomonas sp. TaxID=42353 RepID=UPI0025CD1EF9|nr:hypothetical protein [Nitrosomonas sp.]UJP02032.1 MAG: hypothetical protein LZF85_09585 [Nitrosomonas sp.]
MNPRILAIAVTVKMVTATGCTTQQLYSTGQSWQRNECSKIMDQQERARCLSSTSASYEAYKKQSDIEGKQGR